MYFCQSGFDVECAIHPEHHLWSVWGNQSWGLAGLDPVWGDAGQVNKSLLWIRIWIRIHTDPHSFWSAGSGSGSRRAKIKMTHKSEEISLLRDEEFSCSSNVLYGGLGIGKLQCSINSAVNFFLFLVINTLDLDPDPHWQKMLDPDPHWQKMLDPDPHWTQCGSTTLPGIIHKSINTFQYLINATFLIIL